MNLMGAKITGAGTDTIRIEGVSALKGCTYTVIPDRLIAGAFLMAAGVTGGSVTVQEVIPAHLRSCIAKLREIGIEIEENEQSITAHSTGMLRATRVRTAMYPGFATDLQQPLTALLTQAGGKSIIGERIYPARFNHAYQRWALISVYTHPIPLWIRILSLPRATKSPIEQTGPSQTISAFSRCKKRPRKGLHPAGPHHFI